MRGIIRKDLCHLKKQKSTLKKQNKDGELMYTDYDFYENIYFGDILTQENANKWLSRACDEIDHYTFNRLHSHFPTDNRDSFKVQKAVCAVAEILYKIDEQRAVAELKQDEHGNIHGAISSISSGRESISYSVTGSSASSYARAAADETERENVITDVLCKYIANIPDSTGVNLLYAGVDKHVSRHSYFV